MPTPREGSDRWPPASRPGAFRIALLLIAGAALVLRLAAARQESLWGDETYSHAIATAPLGESLHRVAIEDIFNPPLYYLVLRASVSLLGDGPLGLRIVSVLASVGVVLLAGVLGRRWLRSDPGGLLAATLVAANDVQVHYGHEARSYALYALLVLLVLWLLERAADSGRRRAWLAFALGSTALVYTHYVGALYLLATLPVVLRSGRSAVLAWAACMGLTAALLAPWALVVVPHALSHQGMVEWLGRAPWTALPQTLAEFTGILPVPAGTRISIALGLGLASIGVWWLRRSSRDASSHGRWILPVAACFAPIILLLAVGLVRPIWHSRYVVPSQALWCVLLAGGVVGLGRRAVAPSIALGSALVGLQLADSAQHAWHRRNQPYDEAAAFLQRSVGPDEPVFVTTDFIIGAPLRYYLSESVEPRALPDRPEDLPASLWIAFRPGSASESRRVADLSDAGWETVQREMFASRDNAENGTEIRRLRKR